MGTFKILHKWLTQIKLKVCKNAWWRWGGTFDVDQKVIQINEEEKKTQDPVFWDDPKKAEKILKEIKRIKFWVDSYTQLERFFNDLEVLIEFAQMGEDVESDVELQSATLIKALEELEFKNMLSGEEDTPVSYTHLTLPTTPYV